MQHLSVSAVEFALNAAALAFAAVTVACAAAAVLGSVAGVVHMARQTTAVLKNSEKSS